MKPSETDDMIMADLFTYLEGYQQRIIQEWQHTRRIAYTIAAANRNPKKQFPSMHKWMPLPGDEEMMAEHRASRKKQYEEIKEHYKKIGLI